MCAVSEQQRVQQQRIMQVLQYLEQHLDEAIDVQKLAEFACYSPYHFHRIFRVYTGESVCGYRQRLLLERAAKQLKFDGAPITEIALNCGYDNQSSFNKAFKKRFACTPGEYRQSLNRETLSRPQLNQIVSAEQHRRGVMNAKMDTASRKLAVKIVERVALQLYCSRALGDYQNAASQAWSSMMRYAYGQKLMTPKVEMFGICLDDPTVTEPNRIRYQAGLNLLSHPVPQSAQGEVFISELAGGRYAMAVHRGAYDNLNQTYEYLFSIWLEESGEQLRDTPCFERYLNRDPRRTKPENLKTEIYIPLR
ncbi:Right origin-binding protein [Vibrio stylophorae]|uniref:Right origin-binding protein n=1 Tax=Vibrio stylophorae TaxID=659351 RepID=A0ABM8ZQW7_9VIBR|nr:AraC family transcriptional regulator [Vibrio stylophorae]CAH0532702.1 Right origin-binding protein [Vibrio stylophorae]